MAMFGDATVNLPQACQDVGVTVKRLREDVDTIKEWLRLQPHLPNIEDGLLVENMLLRSKGSVELAKQTLDFFFSSRSTYPELFSKLDPCSEEIELSQEVRKIMFLKNQTSEGYRVAMTHLPDPNRLESFHMKATFRHWIMQADVLLEEDISCGLIYIIDMSNLCMAHTTLLIQDFTLFQNVMLCVFSGYKARIKGIHLIYPPPAVQAVLRLVKTVLPKKIAGRVHLHADLVSLHAHVDKHVLPKDFGGDQKPFLELAAEWRSIERTYRQWFQDHEKLWVTDESKRPKDSVKAITNDSFGTKGTFKKLEFD